MTLEILPMSFDVSRKVTFRKTSNYPETTQ